MIDIVDRIPYLTCHSNALGTEDAVITIKERSESLTMLKLRGLVVVVSLFAANSFSAVPSPITPARGRDALVLFDAARHGPEAFRNYTASWRKGSELVPVTIPVTKGAEKFVQFSYKKDKGTAISLIRFENLPRPPGGVRYNGIKLVIDYDKQDYTHVAQSDMLELDVKGLKRSLCVKNVTKSEETPVELSLSDREKSMLKAGGKIAAIKAKQMKEQSLRHFHLKSATSGRASPRLCPRRPWSRT